MKVKSIYALTDSGWEAEEFLFLRGCAAYIKQWYVAGFEKCSSKPLYQRLLKNVLFILYYTAGNLKFSKNTNNLVSIVSRALFKK